MIPAIVDAGGVRDVFAIDRRGGGRPPWDNADATGRIPICPEEEHVSNGAPCPYADVIRCMLPATDAGPGEPCGCVAFLAQWICGTVGIAASAPR